MKYLHDVPDVEVNKITFENAMRLFQYDPFAHRPKEKCTVEALRMEAADVDTSLRSRGKKEHSKLSMDLDGVSAN
jgi:hypothetical protein